MTHVKTTALIAAIIAGIGLSASADDAQGRGARPQMPSFAELDSNADGVLTPAELAAPAAARFAQADANGDGMLSADELAAMAAQARADRMIERHDSDGDGQLSAEEMPGPDGARMIDHLDKDGDGAISEDEFADARDHGPRGGRHGDRDGHRHGGRDHGPRTQR